MKQVIFSFVFVLVYTCLHAQVDTVFFNEEWDVVSRQNNPSYFRPQPGIENNKYKVIDYYLNGVYQMVGFYDLAAPFTNKPDTALDKYRNGKFEYYWDNGVIESVGEFAGGEKQGKWIYYYRNGNIASERSFIDGKVDGEIRYFDSATGKIFTTGYHEKGLRTGIWHFYYKGTDNLKSIQPHKKEKVHGEVIFYDSATQKKNGERFI